MSNRTAPRSPLSRMARRFARHKLALASLIFLILLCIAAAAAPWLSSYTVDGQDLDLLGLPTAPSAAHWFGTDQLGRDDFTRVLYGARVSLSVGLAAAAVATALGTLVGAISGFYRGLPDILLMRFTDIVLSIPTLPLVLLLSGLLRPTVPALVLIIGALGWMGTARQVRGQFLTLRERDYVEAVRALGGSRTRMIWRHILPNAVGPITLSATLVVGQAVLLESAMSFFGFGIQAPTPTWGNLLNEAGQWLDGAPWLAFPPGALIFATVLAVNFFGDGLRDAVDTRA